MPLEAGDGFISGLVITNPVNATDQVAQGDDHIRLIKAALQGTFPNLNAAVTPSPAELNVLDGATLSTAELNILDGATLSVAELNILDGVTLTAAQINDAARKGAANVFTSNTQTIQGSAPNWSFENTSAGAGLQYWRFGAESDGDWFISTRTDSGAVFGEYAVRITRNSSSEVTAVVLSGDTVQLNGTVDINGNIDVSGTVTTPDASAAEVGYKGAPQNAQNGNYTLVLTDAGKTIYKGSGGAGETITIPANGSVAFPVGTITRIVNNGGGDLTIAITTDTLSLAGAGTTGSRTLGDHGIAVLEKVAATEWFISGVGLS